MTPGPALKFTTLGLLTLIWGTTWAAIRLGLEGIPPFTGVSLRFAVAGALLGLYAATLGRERCRVPLRLFVVLGVCTFTVSYAVVYWAQQWVPSGLASVLFATFPFFTALFAHLWLPEERLTRATAVGAVLGFLGVAVIFSEDLRALAGPGVALAAVVFLLSPLASAVANVAVKKWGETVHPVPLNAWAMLLGAALTGVLAIAFERDRELLFDAQSVGALIYLAVAGTALTFSLYFWLLKHMRASRLALIGYTIPVVAVAIGTLVLDEPLTWRLALGAALVIFGVALAGRPVRTSVEPRSS